MTDTRLTKYEIFTSSELNKDGLVNSELDGLGIPFRPVPPSAPELRWDGAPIKCAFSMYCHAKGDVGPLAVVSQISVALQGYLLQSSLIIYSEAQSSDRAVMVILHYMSGRAANNIILAEPTIWARLWGQTSYV